MGKKKYIPDDAPETIWLQWSGEDTAEPGQKFGDGEEICWCANQIFDTDLEYRLVRRGRK